MKISKTFWIAALLVACSGLAVADEMPFDQAHYEAMHNNGKPFAVAFHATWCPTCRAQAPVLKELTQTSEFKGITIFVANFDTEKVLERSLGVTKQSTIVVFNDGKETARSTGDTQRESLAELLRHAVP
jgi:thiol-disulfide isomerase/thioredoxin